MNNTNAVAWFEIPTADFAKSIPFYDRVFGVKLEAQPFGHTHLAIFPYTKPGVGGCLLQEKGLASADKGTIVYLPVDKVDEALAHVGEAGGTVVIGKTEIGPGMGFFARVRDLEGNVVGLFGME